MGGGVTRNIRANYPSPQPPPARGGGGSSPFPGSVTAVGHKSPCPKLKQRSPREAERLSLNQYLIGTVPYTTVVQTQTSALSAEQTLLNIRQNRLIASANLVKALGGGWREADLPPPVPIGGLTKR